MEEYFRRAAATMAENKAKEAKAAKEREEEDIRENAIAAKAGDVPLPALPKPVHRMKAKDIQDYRDALAKASPFTNKNSGAARAWIEAKLNAKVPKEVQEAAAASAKYRAENEAYINEGKADYDLNIDKSKCPPVSSIPKDAPMRDGTSQVPFLNSYLTVKTREYVDPKYNEIMKCVADIEREPKNRAKASKAALTKGAKDKVVAAYEQDKATYAKELAKQKDELIKSYEDQGVEAKQAREAKAAKAKEEREQKIAKEKQELTTKHEGLNKEAKAKDQEKERLLDEMLYENEHRAEINSALNKVKTGDNCTSTAVDNLAMEHRDNIESEVEDEYDELDDDDELEGGYGHFSSIADQMRMINQRYAMNYPDGRSHITIGNASRKKNGFKGGANVQLENFNKKVASELYNTYKGKGFEKIKHFENQMRSMMSNHNPKNKLEGGLAGALVQLARTGVKLLNELYGPQIEAGLKQMVQQVAQFFNQIGDNFWCNTHRSECRQRNADRERAQREAEREAQRIENERYKAEYEAYLTAEYQNKLEDEQEKMQDDFEKEYEQIETQMSAKNAKEDEEGEAALEKAEEEGEAELEKAKEELEGKQSKYIESQKERKKNFDEAVVKNVEQRMANRGKDNEATAKLRNFKNCASNVNQAEKDRHEAIEEERARREKEEDDKAKGITPSNPNGSGRKTGKKSKKFSIREALKYY